INWTLIGTGNDPATGDIYWGLDRFGRVDNCLWKKSTTTLAQIQYGYDRASNRTWRDDSVLTGYDELYAYDGLYRLNDQKRGTLTGTTITSGTFEQQWGLDATGNWKSFKQDNDGNGSWELVQTRAANKVNEITVVNNTTGAAWAKPDYDAAGNMIGIPNPPATTTGSTPAWVPFTEAQWNTFTEAQWNAFTENTGTTAQALSAQYDAWNRVVLITNGTQKVSENVYDARGYRIRKDTYTSGTLTEARHYYYTPGWQVVEERVGTTTTAERQFVWGQRYIDDLILRDRSTANNGTINERRYAMQDGNWNTIAICDITGSVGERYAYSAYGSPVFMNGSGTVQTSSAIGFETLYAGYRFDGATPQMYYVRNRFLLPKIGTWNRRDPFGYVDGLSLYEYVNGIVCNYTDPSGNQSDEGKVEDWYPNQYHFEGSAPMWIRWRKYSGDFTENNRCYHKSSNPEVHVGCDGRGRCTQVQFVQIASATELSPKGIRTHINTKKLGQGGPGGPDIRWRTQVSGKPGGRCAAFLDAPLKEGGGVVPFYANTSSGPFGDYLIDAPGSNMAANGEAYILESCAICTAGRDKGKILGCIEWGYKVSLRDATQNGGKNLDPYCVEIPSVCRKGPSDLWKAVIEKYRSELEGPFRGQTLPFLDYETNVVD
ncbi:MAG: hypothetical protein NTX48_06845, partial [Planctomycetales bacterium]|nr:hypothetical protein [Planctomycetales bacterium]